MTLGEILKNKRIEKGFTIEKIIELTGIQKKYIKALEEDDKKNLPSEIYVRFFLRDYGIILGLNINELFNLYKKNSQIEVKQEKLNKEIKINSPHKTKSFSWLHFYNFLNIPSVIASLVLIISIFIFLSYIGFGVYKLSLPPKLIITNPQNNLLFNKNNIEITGSTDVEVEIFINDELVLNNGSGNFVSKINLQKGLNIIKITARNRHGKESIEYLKLVYEPK